MKWIWRTTALALLSVLAAGLAVTVNWLTATPRPVIEPQVARAEKVGMTLAEANKLLGVPPGDYRTARFSAARAVNTGKLKEWKSDEVHLIVELAAWNGKERTIDHVTIRTSPPRGNLARLFDWLAGS